MRRGRPCTPPRERKRQRKGGPDGSAAARRSGGPRGRPRPLWPPGPPNNPVVIGEHGAGQAQGQEEEPRPGGAPPEPQGVEPLAEGVARGLWARNGILQGLVHALSTHPLVEWSLLAFLTAAVVSVGPSRRGRGHRRRWGPIIVPENGKVKIKTAVPEALQPCRNPRKRTSSRSFSSGRAP